MTAPISHVYAGSYHYEVDVVRDYDEEDRPMYDSEYVEVEASFCGLEDYQGKMVFVCEEAQATCQDCIDTYALRLLGEL